MGSVKSVPALPNPGPRRSAALFPRTFVFAALPLAAVALGGSTARWSEGLVLLVVGLLLFAAPPRVSLGWGINTVLAGLVLLAATAFLPVEWFKVPAWRAALTEDFGVVLPWTLSPQPWLAAEGLILFLGGIGWFYLMGTAAWTGEERPRAGRWFAGGVVVLAGAFVVSYRLHVTPSFWHSVHGFGPFPNRNQTANFLAVGALPVLACAHLAWRGSRRVAAGGWLAGWVVVATALFHNFSRAGIGILFAGTAVYLGHEILRATRRNQPTAGGGNKTAAVGRWRAPALGASLFLLLASGFMIFGGDTLQRVRPASVDSTVSAMTGDFRLRIQRDALDMIADSPWCGVGLGSFEPVFATYRTRSVVELHVVHPESDWLWMTAELGWPALALTLAALFLLARRVWPQRAGTDRPLRTAAALGAAAFALHGFVDVSAHRVGTVWCGLFLLGLALPAPREEGQDFRRPACWPVYLFRLLGMVLLGCGALWLLADRGKVEVPGAQQVARLTALSRVQASGREWTAATEMASRGLALDPLDWQLYFQRALARLDGGGDHAAALADFRRVLYLEPVLGSVAEFEALSWALAREPELAVSALLEACRRTPGSSNGYFQSVCSAAGNDPAFFDRLAAATRGDPRLELCYVEQLPPPARGAAVAGLVETDPELRHYDDDAQRAHLLRLWASDPVSFSTAMEAHPAWQKLGWRWWADACARTGAFDRACRIAAQFAPRPAIPPVVPGADGRTPVQLRIDADRSPDDLAAALRLYRAQQAAGDTSGALTTLHRVTTRSGSPAYFHYLEATLAADAGQWKTGWDAWEKYLAAVPANG